MIERTQIENRSRSRSQLHNHVIQCGSPVRLPDSEYLQDPAAIELRVQRTAGRPRIVFGGDGQHNGAAARDDGAREAVPADRRDSAEMVCPPVAKAGLGADGEDVEDRLRDIVGGGWPSDLIFDDPAIATVFSRAPESS
jgi:hypothetical protein